MNRRSFLKALAAIGSSFALPVSSASETALDKTWTKLLREPQIFYVLDNGLITTSEEGIAIDVSSRAALWGVSIPTTQEELLALAESKWDIPGVIESIPLKDGRYVSDWQSWIQKSRSNLKKALDAVRAWLSQSPNEIDIELAMSSECTGQGEAYLFFSTYDECNEALDIDIVESDTLWSHYGGAELRSSVADANERAIKLGLPVRFISASKAA
jgi:hypothetical protein